MPNVTIMLKLRLPEIYFLKFRFATFFYVHIMLIIIFLPFYQNFLFFLSIIIGLNIKDMMSLSEDKQKWGNSSSEILWKSDHRHYFTDSRLTLNRFKEILWDDIKTQLFVSSTIWYKVVQYGKAVDWVSQWHFLPIDWVVFNNPKIL